MPRWFFSHLMFAMMPIWSWLSPLPLHAVCESVKFLVWHGTVSIFLRKASQTEQHPSLSRKSSSVSTRRPWSPSSKRTSSSSSLRARSATRACSFWKSPRPNPASARFSFRRPLPISLNHGSASRNAPRKLSVGEYTDYNRILANGLGLIRWNVRASLHFWTHRCSMFNIAYCYVHSASISPASWMNRRSFSCPKPWANTRDWMLAINKWFDFPHSLEYNKIVEIAQNSSRNTTYYELRYHTGDVFHA